MFDLNAKHSRIYTAEAEDPDEIYLIGVIDINNLTEVQEMNEFSKREDIGRKYFQSWLTELGIEDAEFTADQYEVTDCNFTYKDKDITAEIKVRDEKYRKYSTHFMELNKYINIQHYVDKNNKDGALYVNFFGENWCYIYTVNQINISRIDTVNLVRTTAEDKGKRNKEIINIPTSLAQIYHRQNKESKWSRIK